MTEILPLQTYSARPSRTRPTKITVTALGATSRSLLRRLTQAWIQHRDEKLLQSLTDHQLRDIGLSRAQIPQVARDGWDR